MLSKSEMSAPAVNAFVPEPRSTTQRTSGSASNCANAAGMPRHIAALIAFRLAGLSKTSQPVDPRFSTSNFPSLTARTCHDQSCKIVVAKRIFDNDMMAFSSSLRRQSGGLHHLLGLGPISLELVGKFLRDAAAGNEATRRKLFLPERRLGENAGDLLHDLVDDRTRRAGRHEKPKPCARHRAAIADV